MLHANAGAWRSVCSDADGHLLAFGNADNRTTIHYNSQTKIKTCFDDEEMPTTMSCDYFNTCVSTNKGNLCFWELCHDAKKIVFDDPNIFVKTISAGRHHTAVIFAHNVVD